MSKYILLYQIGSLYSKVLILITQGYQINVVNKAIKLILYITL